MRAVADKPPPTGTRKPGETRIGSQIEVTMVTATSEDNGEQGEAW